MEAYYFGSNEIEEIEDADQLSSHIAAGVRLLNTITCPCKTENFSAVKIENFIGKFLIFLIVLLKTLIVVC